MNVFLLIFLSLSLQSPPQEGDIMKEVEEAIQTVREGFLHSVRAYEVVQDENAKDHPLATPQETAAQLVADMEALLALLPEGEGEGSGSQSKPKPKPEDIPQENQKDPTQPTSQPQPMARDEQEAETEHGAVSLFAKPSGNQDWGVLPPRLQQALETTSVDELPLRYKRYLERYARSQQQP